MIRKIVFNSFLILLFALSVSYITGCAKPPTQEMAKAEKAVEEAKQKEAHLYVPDIFKQAEDSLKNAKDLVVNKSYKEAKKAAEDTIQISQQAISMIEQNKAKMKVEAVQLMEGIQKDLEEFKIMAAKAIKKKVFASSEDIQKVIGKAEIDLVNVKEKLEGGLVKQAYDDLKTVKELLISQKQIVESKITEKVKN
jgi:negative regulator of replication initiation